MEPRYKVRRRISVEVGGVTNGLRTSTTSPPGFEIYDTESKKSLPDCFSSLSDAERQCDLLNEDA